MWDVNEVTYSGGYYYQVKITVHGCGCKAALSKNKKTYNGLRNPVTIKQTGILLIPHWAFRLSASSFYYLKKYCMKKEPPQEEGLNSLRSLCMVRCKVIGQLENHYLSHHNVVLQVTCVVAPLHQSSRQSWEWSCSFDSPTFPPRIHN